MSDHVESHINKPTLPPSPVFRATFELRLSLSLGRLGRAAQLGPSLLSESAYIPQLGQQPLVVYL
jgi:hypothetical protein